MTLADVLKSKNVQARMSDGDVWLYWDDDNEEFVVSANDPKRNHRKTMLRTTDESEAADCFYRNASREYIGEL